jgi:ABC-type glucose/galactose transport system permease subunit
MLPWKKWQKNWVFDLYYCVQSFQPITFQEDFFGHFFQRFELTSFEFYDTLIKFLIKILFAYFFANRAKQLKNKTYFINMS